MSRLARTISESGVYHILFRGVNQQNIFEEASDFEKLKETIATVKQDLHFEIYAYCFKNNHVHIVLKVKSLGDISLIMKRILTKYARWYNIKYGRSGALIANRYKSVPGGTGTTWGRTFFGSILRISYDSPRNTRYSL